MKSKAFLFSTILCSASLSFAQTGASTGQIMNGPQDHGQTLRELNGADNGRSTFEVVQIRNAKWKALQTNGDFFFNKNRLQSMTEHELHALCGEGFKVASQSQLQNAFPDILQSDLPRPELLKKPSAITNEKAMNHYCSVADSGPYIQPVVRLARIVMMRDIDGKLGLRKTETRIERNPGVAPLPSPGGGFEEPKAPSEDNFCRIYCVGR